MDIKVHFGAKINEELRKRREMTGLTVMNYSYSTTAAMNDMPKRLNTGIITFIVNCGPSI